MLVHSSGCQASNCWGLVGEALAGALQMVVQDGEEAYSLLSECFWPELHLDSPPTYGQKMESWQNVAMPMLWWVRWRWPSLTGDFFCLFHRGLLKLILSYAAQWPQEKGGKKLLWQLGEEWATLCRRKASIFLWVLVLFPFLWQLDHHPEQGKCKLVQKQGAICLPFGFYGSDCKLIHTLCWTHRCMRRPQQYGHTPIGFLSSWRRLQEKWLLQSAWVCSAVLLHPVFVSGLPAPFTLLLPSEEDGWTCPVTSYIRGTGREPHPVWGQGCSELHVHSHTPGHLKQCCF